MPAMTVPREMESTFQVKFIKGTEIALEAPTKEHEISASATKLTHSKYDLGSITQYHY
jgi:hypothetical protein